MNSITIDKTKLLVKLKENRATHETEYKEAKENFQAQLVKALKQKLKLANAGERVELHFDLMEPVEYLNSYDRAIAMLEVAIEEEITLNQNEFSQYWLDEWNWRAQFFASNRAYSESVSMKAGAAGF